MIQNFLTIFFRACPIQSDLTMTGVCMSGDECSQNGGTIDGNCASGSLKIVSYIDDIYHFLQ